MSSGVDHVLASAAAGLDPAELALDTGTVEVLRASTSGWRQPLGTFLNVSSTSANSASSSVRPRNSST